MDLSAIYDKAFRLFGTKSSHPWKEKGNKFHHGQRTANLALTIRKLVLPEDGSHDGIIKVAAWFHDIENGTENHEKAGAERTGEILRGCCSADEIEGICEIIEYHDDRCSDGGNRSVYLKIHQDADHLDHFGTFEIWAIFRDAASHGVSMDETVDFLTNTRLNEYEKYRNELNFAVSKKIYDEKHGFLKDFTNRFAVENKGELWNFNL